MSNILAPFNVVALHMLPTDQIGLPNMAIFNTLFIVTVRKDSKIIVTELAHFTFEMHQSAFLGWVLPGPTGGPCSAPPDFLAGFW